MTCDVQRTPKPRKSDRSINHGWARIFTDDEIQQLNWPQKGLVCSPDENRQSAYRRLESFISKKIFCTSLRPVPSVSFCIPWTTPGFIFSCFAVASALEFSFLNLESRLGGLGGLGHAHKLLIIMNSKHFLEVLFSHQKTSEKTSF